MCQVSVSADCEYLVPFRPGTENEADMNRDWDEDPESLFKSQDNASDAVQTGSNDVGESFSPELFGEDEVRCNKASAHAGFRAGLSMPLNRLKRVQRL